MIEVGRLAANVMHFARLLRRAGLPVGPAEMLAAERAVALVDIGRRAEVRTALRTTMVHRHEQEDLFDQAFVQFWRDPTLGKTTAAMALLEAAKERPPERAPPGARRIAEALAAPREQRPAPEPHAAGRCGHDRVGT